jgi:hypothetical protein
LARKVVGGLGLVHEAGARRFFQRRRQRAIFLTVGPGQLGDLAQVILRLITIALFDLPEAVILPGLDVVRIGFQRALVPDLRQLVVAELAIRIADQIGDGRRVVAAERLQLIDRRGIVVAIVDRGIGGPIAVGEFCVLLARSELAALLLFALGGGGRRRVVVGRGVDRRDEGALTNASEKVASASSLIADLRMLPPV